MKKLTIIVLALTLIITAAQAKASAEGPVFDTNIAADIKAQMVNDLVFIQSIRSSAATAMHQKVFGAVDGTSYYKWFTARVLKVGKHTCGSGSAVACVIPMLDSTKIWITDNYIKFSHPQIARLSVLYHEARHTEVSNGNWHHARCPTPFRNEQGRDMQSIWTGATLAGEAACDITPYESYGSSTILLKNVSKFCASCTEKVRTDAGIYADDQINRITDVKSKDDMKKDFAAKRRR